MRMLSLIKPHASVLSSRERGIVKMRRDGGTYQSIGDEYDLTKERIRQILRLCSWKIGEPIQRRMVLGVMPTCRACGQPVDSKIVQSCGLECRLKVTDKKNEAVACDAIERRISSVPWVVIGADAKIAANALQRLVACELVRSKRDKPKLIHQIYPNYERVPSCITAARERLEAIK